MAKILVLSDLHIEHYLYPHLDRALPDFDVAVFAGDIAGSPVLALTTLARTRALLDKPIIFVPGNHEFYGGNIDRLQDKVARLDLPSHVVMLAPGVAEFFGVRFIGATLWTDYALYRTPDQSMRVAAFELADHFNIVGPDGSKRFLPKDALARHLAERAFLEAELAKPFAGPRVIVTHHAPHKGSIHSRWQGDSLTPAFVSDLSDLIGLYAPNVWVHGHVHDSFDYSVGSTRILCNPRGYGSENQHRFRPDLIIEV